MSETLQYNRTDREIILGDSELLRQIQESNLVFKPTHPNIDDGDDLNTAAVADFVDDRGQKYYVKRTDNALLEALALLQLRDYGLQVAEVVVATEQVIVTREIKGKMLLPENGKAPDRVARYVHEVFDPAMERMWREVPWTKDQYGQPVIRRDCKLEHFRDMGGELGVVDAVSINPEAYLPKIDQLMVHYEKIR